jgi:hypothetical protein
MPCWPMSRSRRSTSYGWVTAGEMLDGLGLAETTPGPLIMVTQFVGFLGAWRDHGDESRCSPERWAGLLTTWVTFTPCFLWIFVGAPYRRGACGRNKALSGRWPPSRPRGGRHPEPRGVVRACMSCFPKSGG